MAVAEFREQHVNRHDRRKQKALGSGMPTALAKLRSRDPFVAFTSDDPEHLQKLERLSHQLVGLLGDFSWLDGMAVCLKLAAVLAVVGEQREQLGGRQGPLTGFDEDTFAENARRNYQLALANGYRPGSSEVS